MCDALSVLIERLCAPWWGRALQGAVCSTWGGETLSRGWLRSALCFGCLSAPLALL